MRVYYVCQEIRTTNPYEAIQAGDLRGAEVFMDVYSPDPVLRGRHVYADGGWDYIGPPPLLPIPQDPESNAVPPECGGNNCKWLQRFAFDRQRNALRVELVHLVEERRCGWNLLPGRLGGHALDYAPCTYPAHYQQENQP